MPAITDNPTGNAATELSARIRASLHEAQAAFFQLYEQFFPLVFNVLRKESNQGGRRLSREELGNLTCHVFSRLWEELTRGDRSIRFESDFALVGYLKRIAVNHLTDAQRARRSVVSLDGLPTLLPDPRPPEAGALEKLTRDEASQETLNCLTQTLAALQEIGKALPIKNGPTDENTGKPGLRGSHLMSKMRRLFNEVDGVLVAIAKTKK